MKAFIDFFKFTGLLLATVIVSSLLVWHPWIYNPKATSPERSAEIRRPPESATAAPLVSHSRPPAATLDRKLQARREQEKIAKGTAVREVIQRFHLPVHKGYPVISTIEERNALPPGTTYLTSNGQYAVQLSRVGASP
jgi:hypothetical protein